MAMVFALVTHLREALVTVIQERIAKENERERAREQEILEVIISLHRKWQHYTYMSAYRQRLLEQKALQLP